MKRLSMGCGVVILIIIVAIMLSGQAVQRTESMPATSVPRQVVATKVPATSVPRRVVATKVPAFELLEYKWQYDGGLRYIVGSVRNMSAKQYRYVQVQFTLYDKDGAQVGSALANVNNLEAHGLWKFKAIVLEDSAMKAKFAELTGSRW